MMTDMFWWGLLAVWSAFWFGLSYLRHQEHKRRMAAIEQEHRAVLAWLEQREQETSKQEGEQ